MQFQIGNELAQDHVPFGHFLFPALHASTFNEMVLPKYGVRFIAVNDGVGSIKGDSEFTAIRSIFNVTLS